MTKINNHLDFILKEELCDIVFVTGATRSGKIVLSRILSSLERAENVKVDYLTEFIPPLRRMNEISDEACVAMLRYSIYLMTYNNFIGRNMNIRTNDFTSIWNTREPLEYFKRLYASDVNASDRDNVDDILSKIKSHNPIFHMMMHYELMHIDILLKSFPSCKVYFTRKHPIELIYSWFNKDYGINYYDNPRVDTPVFKYNKETIPYYALGWEEEFIQLNEMDRIVKMICNQFQVSQKKYSNLSASEVNRIKIFNFDQLVTVPHQFIREICNDLNTKETSYTQKVLIEERCPRELNLNDRSDKFDFIKKHASSKYISLLEDTILKYEKFPD